MTYLPCKTQGPVWKRGPERLSWRLEKTRTKQWNIVSGWPKPVSVKTE